MASRFSASDVAVLSREQKIEALGIALRMKAAYIRWEKEGSEGMSDQECLDAAIDYEFDPTGSPQLPVTFGDGIDWADQDAFNPYRWQEPVVALPSLEDRPAVGVCRGLRATTREAVDAGSRVGRSVAAQVGPSRPAARRAGARARADAGLTG
jgi:hypothetical protein